MVCNPGIGSDSAKATGMFNLLAEGEQPHKLRKGIPSIRGRLAKEDNWYMQAFEFGREEVIHEGDSYIVVELGLRFNLIIASMASFYTGSTAYI